MEVRCENCSAKLNIADEKVPAGQRVLVRCPKCKSRLAVERPAPREDDAYVSFQEEALDRGNLEADYGYGFDDDALDFFEEGVTLALVLETDPQQMEALKSAVESLGNRFVSGQNTREAIGKLRLHHFDLVLLSDSFDDIPLTESPILHHVNHLPMSTRRKMFVALIGDNFKTMDQMMAFAMSANVVINREDMDRLAAILKHTISDNEKFYKVFMDTLVEVGRT